MPKAVAPLLLQADPTLALGAATKQYVDAVTVADLGQPMARVTHSATQSIANVTPVGVLFNTEAYDTHGLHDNAVNNNRFTIPTGQAGRYRFSAQLHFPVAAGVIRQLALLRLGVPIMYDNRANASGNTVTCMVDATLDMVVGDYVSLNVYHDAGSAILLPTAAYTPWFEAVRVA